MFKFASDVKVGDVFTRTDKNGKVWEAKVINRTEYFVDVEKTSPYQIKVYDEEPIYTKRFYNGGWHQKCINKGIFHYEDIQKTYERCEIIALTKLVCVGKKKTLFGEIDDYQDIPTGNYGINVKEEYSRYPQYDKTYRLIKVKDED